MSKIKTVGNVVPPICVNEHADQDRIWFFETKEGEVLGPFESQSQMEDCANSYQELYDEQA